jgi:predicted RNase H-like HicB family nuclease
MPRSECTVVVRKLDNGRYRATCHLFPDCETFAATEEEARHSMEEVIDRLIRQRNRNDGPATHERSFP